MKVDGKKNRKTALIAPSLKLATNPRVLTLPLSYQSSNSRHKSCRAIVHDFVPHEICCHARSCAANILYEEIDQFFFILSDRPLLAFWIVQLLTLDLTINYQTKIRFSDPSIFIISAHSSSKNCSISF